MTFNLVVKGLAAVWRYETFESPLPRKLNARQNVAKDLKVKFTENKALLILLRINQNIATKQGKIYLGLHLFQITNSKKHS